MVGNLVGSVITGQGLHVKAALDECTHEPGMEVSDADLAEIKLKRDELRSDWNHRVTPRAAGKRGQVFNFLLRTRSTPKSQRPGWPQKAPRPLPYPDAGPCQPWRRAKAQNVATPFGRKEGKQVNQSDPGEPAAIPVDVMFSSAYAELRRLARSRLRDGGRNTVLDTTALVHETYLRVSKSASTPFPDRPRFLVYAGRAMRSIIIDLVRQRQAERHGGGALHLTLTGDAMEQAALPAGEEHILRVHEALEELAKVDARMAQVVEMRYFAGLSDAEIASALDVGERTVRRDWEHARLLLAKALK